MVAFDRFIQAFLWSSVTLLNAELMLMRHDAMLSWGLAGVGTSYAGGRGHRRTHVALMRIGLLRARVQARSPARRKSSRAWDAGRWVACVLTDRSGSLPAILDI